MTAMACLRLASSFKRFNSLRACERGREMGMNAERYNRNRSAKQQHKTRSTRHTKLHFSCIRYSVFGAG